MKIILTFLVLIYACAYSTVGLGGTLDFNICRTLSQEERDSCLLKLSHSILSPGNESKKIYELTTSFSIREGMLTDTQGFDGAGQFFVTSLTPRLDLSLPGGQLFSISVPATSTKDTGIDNSAITSIGRPEVVALFPLVFRERGYWKIGPGFRPPLYSNSKGTGATYQVWQISFNNSLYRNLGEGFSITGNAGVFYNFEYDYYGTTPHESYLPLPTYQTPDASGNYSPYGHFVQYPITTRSTVGVNKSVGEKTFGITLIGQYGIPGREIADAGIRQVYEIPGINQTSVAATFTTKISRAFLFDLAVEKALIYDSSENAVEANIDDPTYSANIALMVGVRGAL